MKIIKHEPLLDIVRVCELYAEKDGVPITYVCTSALGGEAQAIDIFYRDTPHPKFGNCYFGLYHNAMSGKLTITNADRIESVEFGLIEDDDGNLHYSAHRHDYKMFDNGNMIDGGRSYVKSGMHPVHIYVVRDGKMVVKDFFLSRIDSLEEENKKLKNIIRSAFPEKSGEFFICGKGGNRDEMGLPERIIICPTYGSDNMAVYKKVEDCDLVIIDDLKDQFHRNNKFDKVDCSDDVLEPDYNLLNAILTVLDYYMPCKDYEEWKKMNPVVKRL